jgi:hypothetical protein
VSTVAEVMRKMYAGELTPEAAADAAAALVAGAAVIGAPVPAPEPAPEPAAPAPGFNPYLCSSDPSVEEYLALTGHQQAELEEVLPGVEERLTKASAWLATSQRESTRAAAEADAAEYAQKLSTDPEFAAAEARKASAERLDVAWGSLSNAERLDLKTEAGMSDADFTALLDQKQRRFEEMNG